MIENRAAESISAKGRLVKVKGTSAAAETAARTRQAAAAAAESTLCGHVKKSHLRHLRLRRHHPQTRYNLRRHRRMLRHRRRAVRQALHRSAVAAACSGTRSTAIISRA